MKSIKSLLPILMASVFLVSCQSKKIEKNDKITSVNKLYSLASQSLQEGRYKKAATEFEKVFFQHPGHKIAFDAELMQAYSLYLASEYNEAIDILNIFIELHPRHQQVSYAYYLKALSYYAQISSVKLDQSKTRYAKMSLEKVIKLFPGTKYAVDSALKMDLVNDHLAGKEMTVGRYYLNKKNPIAAINRFQEVIKNYETTSHVTEALYRLVETNLMLGLINEAKRYSVVLKNNYPNSIWDKRSDNLLKK